MSKRLDKYIKEMENAISEIVEVEMKSIKWPERLNTMEVGSEEVIDDHEEHAARKAKTRLEKTTDKLFMIKRVPLNENKLTVFRLK